MRPMNIAVMRRLTHFVSRLWALLIPPWIRLTKKMTRNIAKTEPTVMAQATAEKTVGSRMGDFVEAPKAWAAVSAAGSS